jgi:hypothetical protein
VSLQALRGAILLAACWAGSAGAQESDYAEWFPGGSSTQEPEQFPFGFRGQWAPSDAACRDIDGNDRIEIYPNGIDFYEGGARLERITQAGQDRTVKVKLSFEGEGEFWEAVWLLRLGAGSQRLSVSEDESAWRTYQRCD